MKAEIILTYREPFKNEDGEETNIYREVIEVSCLAELENCANEALRQTGAAIVNFNFIL